MQTLTIVDVVDKLPIEWSSSSASRYAPPSTSSCFSVFKRLSALEEFTPGSVQAQKSGENR